MRIEKFHFYLLDKYDNPKYTGIGDTNELFNVLEADISYTSLGTLKSSLTMKIQESEYLNIDYKHDRVKLVIEIDGSMFNKGIYIIKTSNRNVENGISTRYLTCYSKLKYLDDYKILKPYHLPTGANIYTAIINLLGENPYDITFTDKTLLAQFDRSSGTTKLSIINDLLELINYNSLTVSDDGVFYSKPYVLPQDRTPEIYYIEGEPLQSDNANVCRLICPNFGEECDEFDVPNIFHRFTNSVDIDPPLEAVYPIQPEIGEPVTIDGESPNVSSESVENATDYATLYAQCKRDAIEARNIYDHITIETAINPHHNYLTCVQVKVGDIDYKFIETSWSINLEAGALMKHELRRSVNIDE